MPAMGELIDFVSAMASRDSWLAKRALHAHMHPALRWRTGTDPSPAHRRTPMGRAVCGAGGGLLLADPGTPLCATCYPHHRSSGVGA